MQFILEGILFGLSLAALIGGPLFIALTQSTIEKGLNAGLSVGFGIWFSDALFIFFTYKFVQQISKVVEGPGFQIAMGWIGGIVLISFGLYTALAKLKEISNTEISGIKSYLQFFTKGFLVNTINPFTFVFWISVITTYIVARKITFIQSVQFLGSIFIVIIITDSLKVFLAQILRKRLTSTHILWINRVAGAALTVFGVLLIIWSV